MPRHPSLQTTVSHYLRHYDIHQLTSLQGLTPAQKAARTKAANKAAQEERDRAALEVPSCKFL